MASLKYKSIDELQSEAVKAESSAEGTVNAKYLIHLISRRFRTAAYYDGQKNLEKKFFFLERCMILGRRLLQLKKSDEKCDKKCDETFSLDTWQKFLDGAEISLENIEPILSRLYDENENRLLDSSTPTKYNRRQRKGRRPRANSSEVELQFDSIVQLQSEAVEAESLFESTEDTEFLRKLINTRWRAAAKYQKRKNVEKEYFFLGRCRILIQRLQSKQSDDKKSFKNWKEEIECRLEHLEPILSEMYGDEGEASENEEDFSTSSPTTINGMGRQKTWKLIEKGKRSLNNKHTQFTLMKNEEEQLNFEEWLERMKLRFQTREWRSSLDCDSYKIIRDRDGEKVGIKMEFTFALRQATFKRRMGRSAMNLIKELKSYAPKKNVRLECPKENPEVSFWVIMRDMDEYFDHEEWTKNLVNYLQENIQNYEILEDIKDAKGEPVGVYLRMPYQKAFVKFFREMEDFMRCISYVTKTNQKMKGSVLTRCCDMDFFHRMEDGEFY